MWSDLKRFLNLPVIVGGLPFILTNGTLADADEVQGDLQFIVDQVNANAQPAGGGAADTIAWTLMQTAPTFVSTTSFTMTGNQTASFTIGRRLKSTNTGGTVYSTVIASAVTLNTTVTVTNQSGTLDSGMSEVSISTVEAVNPALPVFTNLFGASTTNVPQATLTVLRCVVAPSGDALSEYTLGTSSSFTPKVTGTYVVSLAGALQATGDNVTLGARISAFIYKNAVLGNTISTVDWPFATGVQSTIVPMQGAAQVSATAGDLIQVKFLGAVYTGGNMIYNGNFAVRRILYP